MHTLQSATLAARAATGDKRISTRANAGRIDIVTAAKIPGGRYDIRVIAGGLTAGQAIEALSALAAVNA